MKDTPPEIEQLYRNMLMQRGNEERFMMGARMFDAARQIVLASLPEGLSETERRVQLFLRFMGMILKRRSGSGFSSG